MAHQRWQKYGVPCMTLAEFESSGPAWALSKGVTLVLRRPDDEVRRAISRPTRAPHTAEALNHDALMLICSALCTLLQGASAESLEALERQGMYSFRIKQRLLTKTFGFVNKSFETQQLVGLAQEALEGPTLAEVGGAQNKNTTGLGCRPWAARTCTASLYRTHSSVCAQTPCFFAPAVHSAAHRPRRACSRGPGVHSQPPAHKGSDSAK